MKSTGLKLLMAVAMLGLGPAQAADAEAQGPKDHPLFTRMPGFVIDQFVEHEFASASFVSLKGTEEKVEGHYFYYVFQTKPGVKDPGALAMKRNIVNAAKKVGGKITRDGEETADMVISRGARETWVRVQAFNSTYRLFILERGEMTQSVVANADALASGLASSGHSSVGGILFDTGKWELKPESAEAIAEVAKVLQKKETLKLAVVGHTDTVGDAESNVNLSRQRATAVMKELVSKHHVTAGRLTSFGAGPFSPIASNATDEGRALNRRVEIVEQ